MLTIKLEIHDDGNDSLAQAQATVRLLHHLYGSAVLPASDRVTVTGITDVHLDAALRKPMTATAPVEAGVPMTEPEASAVFGASVPTPPAPEPVGDDEEAPGPVNNGELDTQGFPWDARIHSETRNTNKDGTWRNRRNLDKSVLEEVTAELNAMKTQRTLHAAQGLVPTPPATPVPPPPVASAPTAAAPAPSPAPAPAPAPSTVPAPPASGNPFVNLMNRVLAAQKAGNLPGEVLQPLFTAVGVKGMAEFAQADKKDLIPQFDALLSTVLPA